MAVIFNINSDVNNLWSLMELIDNDIKELLSFDFKSKKLFETALSFLLDTIGKDPTTAKEYFESKFENKANISLVNWEEIKQQLMDINITIKEIYL